MILNAAHLLYGHFEPLLSMVNFYQPRYVFCQGNIQEGEDIWVVWNAKILKKNSSCLNLKYQHFLVFWREKNQQAILIA